MKTDLVESEKLLRTMLILVASFTSVFWALSWCIPDYFVTVTSSCFLVVASIAWRLLQHHRPIAAAWVLSASILIVGIVASYNVNGIFDGAIFLIPTSVIFASIMLPLRQIIGFTILTVVAAVSLSVLHYTGRLPNVKVLIDTPADFINFPLLILGVHLLIVYTTQQLRGFLHSSNQEKKKWEMLFASAEQGLLIMDTTGKIYDANPKIQKFLNQILVQHTNFYSTTEPLHVLELSMSDSPVVDWNMPAHYSTDNIERICEVQRRQIHIEDRLLWFLVVRDVTEERLLRAKIQQESKLQVIGQITTHIAHDLNNHLAIITSLAESISALSSEQKIQHTAGNITKTALRASDRTRQILQTMRNHPKMLHMEDPAVLLEEVYSSLEQYKTPSIQITLKIASGVPYILIDKVRVYNALLNIAKNSVEAVQEKEQGHIHITCHNDGEYSVFTIKDNGCGIKAESTSRVSEAFYTTKHNGTGLGLFTAEMCATTHEGKLTIDSIEHEGTTISLYIPHHKRSFTPTTMVANKKEQNSSNAGNIILIIEDNIAFAQYLETELQQLGFTTHTLTTGNKAIEHITNNATQLDRSIILVDYRLPDITGADVLRKLPSKPNLIIAMSGDAHSWERENDISSGIAYTLFKPFTIEDVLRKIEASVS